MRKRNLPGILQTLRALIPARWSAKIGIILLLAGFGAGIGLGVFLTRNVPEVDSLQFTVPSLTTRIFSSDGKILQEYGAEKRILVDYQHISPNFIYALVSVEDSSFFHHHGISIRGILRALVTDILKLRKSQGGSTITQQLARQYFLTPRKTFTRKLREMILAVNIERHYSKQQILEMYSNKVYFGHGYYGVESASRFYFGKPASDLTLAQGAFLAGIIQRPTYFSPKIHPKRALARRNFVLYRMWQTGHITKAQYKTARANPLKVVEKEPGDEGAAADVTERIRIYLENKYGEETLYNKGLNVYTTINAQMQAEAVKALREGLHAYDHRHGYRGPQRGDNAPEPDTNPNAFKDGARVWGAVTSVERRHIEVEVCGQTLKLSHAEWRWAGYLRPERIFKKGDRVLIHVLETQPHVKVELDQMPDAQAALLAVDPHTGDVKALVGGYDFDQSQFNRVIQAHRQTGSAVKPLIYATAFANGYTLADRVIDEPTMFLTGREDPAKVCEEGYIPRDFDKEYFGEITLRTALEHSINICAVHLLNQVGYSRVISLMRKMHITAELKPYPSMALGAFEITLWQLTGAYATLDNQGVYIKPHYITRITDRNGKILEAYQPIPETVLDPGVAYITIQGMEGVIKAGTARSAAGMKGHFAGKTGTTDDYSDSWFLGFNPDLVCGVWAGKDDHTSLGKLETGARVALPIWEQFMTTATQGQENDNWAQPANVTKVLIDPDTGLRAGVDTPCSAVAPEYFIKGTAPTKMCSPVAHYRLKLPFFLQRYPIRPDFTLVIPQADLTAWLQTYPNILTQVNDSQLLISWKGTTFPLKVDVTPSPPEPPPAPDQPPPLPKEGSVACGAVVEYVHANR
ncbi:MAG: PBP1A family penicillin-binding protein [Acidobacteriota bacterium]